MLKLSNPHITEKAIAKVINVLNSGNLVQGKFVKEFEDYIKNYLNVNHAILVSSGTAALHLSLMALNIKEGDEVIVPAFTFPAPANVVEILGAKPVLVDILLDDFCIDPTSIEDAITDRTKVIIPVHEFGQSAEMDKILVVARKYGLNIVEDAACALGAEFKNQKIGILGELGCFSFHPRKMITTGEGGAIVTNDTELAKKVKSLRNHGISANNGKNDFIYPGLNYRITDIQAVLGLTQLQEIDKLIENRIYFARKYDDYLGAIELIKIPKRFIDRKSIYQTYHILVDDEIDRDKLIIALKEYDIETNIGAQALCSLRYFKNRYNLKSHDYPNAERAYNKGLALPIGNHLSEEEVSIIARKLIKVCNVEFMKTKII